MRVYPNISSAYSVFSFFSRLYGNFIKFYKIINRIIFSRHVEPNYGSCKMNFESRFYNL